jgi:hypothetical protein
MKKIILAVAAFVLLALPALGQRLITAGATGQAVEVYIFDELTRKRASCLTPPGWISGTGDPGR